MGKKSSRGRQAGKSDAPRNRKKPTRNFKRETPKEKSEDKKDSKNFKRDTPKENTEDKKDSKNFKREAPKRRTPDNNKDSKNFKREAPKRRTPDSNKDSKNFKREAPKRRTPDNKTETRNFKREEPTKSTEKKTDVGGTRLNKFISNAGICSRREADTYIEHGSVTVNGDLITEMGYKVQLGDEVRFDGSQITQEAKRYVLLNKPKNYITTMDDDRGRKTVMDLIVNATSERIYPVGRLDRNTTGLLLFTNDGELAKKLTHPKHDVRKLYQASLDKKLTLADLEKLRGEVLVEGRKVFIDAVSYVIGEKKTEVGIEIHSGRNRIVRKIFEQLGYSVIKLDRVIFSGLTKKNLPRGRYRELTQQEISSLHMV